MGLSAQRNWITSACKKEVITKEDLLDLLLILQNARKYKENWLEKEFSKLNIVFISNLGMNAGIMAMNGLRYPIPIEGVARY